jgi:hypothetical protein
VDGLWATAHSGNSGRGRIKRIERVHPKVRRRTDGTLEDAYCRRMNLPVHQTLPSTRQVLAWLAGAWLLALTLPGSAVDSRGARSCYEWQKHRAEATEGYPLDADIIQTWLVGYFSGVVAGAGMDFLVGTKNPRLFEMADVLCQRHPQADLAFIGTAIARELMQEKNIVNRPTLP